MVKAKLLQHLMTASYLSDARSPLESAQHIVLPELYCPFPSAINRFADIVDKRTIEWVCKYNLLAQEADYRRFSAVSIGWLTARTNPTATLNNLQIVTDWCSWFFIRDDYSDELGIGRQPEALMMVNERFVEILHGADLVEHDTVLTHALYDLCQRTMIEATDRWKQRFIHNLQEFFAAGVWEARNRAQGVIPNVPTYLTMRPFTGGLYAYIDLLEISEQISLPLEVHEHATIRELTTLANNVVCWANDIMSLAKEMKQGDVHNLVLSIQQRGELALQDAVDRATALHDSAVRAFIDLELRLPSFGAGVDADLKGYTAALRTFMRGSLDWLYISGRYFIRPIVTG